MIPSPASAERVDVCVLGGGMPGLAAAHELAQERIPHLLLDKAPQLGGSLRPLPIAEIQANRFYPPLFPHDRAALSLLGKLRMQDQLAWRRAPVGMIFGNRHFKMGGVIGFVMAGPLGMTQAIQFLRAVGTILRIPDASVFDNQAALPFLRRFFGADLANRLFLPFLEAQFGAAMENISAALVVEQIWAMAGACKRLGFLSGGLATLLSGLQHALWAAGGKTETSARVVSVERVGTTYRVLWERQGEVRQVWADAIINTFPIPIFLRVAKNPPPRYVLDLEAIRYQGSITLMLATERSIAPCYWSVVARKDSPFWMIVEPSRLGGGPPVLIVSRTVPKTDPSWKMSDQEIFASMMQDLGGVFGDMRAAIPRDWRIVRDEFATPIFEKGFLRKVPAQKTPWEGLFNAGLVHTYPEGNFLGGLIDSGNTAARLGMEYLKNRDATSMKRMPGGTMPSPTR